MFNKWHKYSYAAQKQQRSRILMILIWVLGIFVLYTVITTFFLSVLLVETESMQPNLETGDRLIVLSYKFYHMLPESARKPLRLGQVVLVNAAGRKEHNIFFKICDSVVSFFSARQLSLLEGKNSAYIKRVIGLPGDEISMAEFVVRIKPAGKPYPVTEFELASQYSQLYETVVPRVSELWDESLPFSGSMDPILLKNDECFLFSDDRSNTNDSRTWGSVGIDSIAGRVVFRYWPFSRFGPL